MSWPALTYILMWLLLRRPYGHMSLFRFGVLQSERAPDWFYVWLPLGGPIATLLRNDNTQRYLVWGKQSLFLAWFPWVEWVNNGKSTELSWVLIATLICQGIPHFSQTSRCELSRNFLGKQIHCPVQFLEFVIRRNALINENHLILLTGKYKCEYDNAAVTFLSASFTRL